MTPCRQTHAPSATRRKAVASKSADLSKTDRAAVTARYASRLPVDIQLDLDIPFAAKRVLAVLLGAANADRQCELSVKEIAERAWCGPRAVQYARRALESRNLLRVTERRISRDRNETNLWRPDDRLFARSGGVGAKPCAPQNNIKNYNNNHTSQYKRAREKICRVQNDGADKPRGLRASPEPIETGSRRPSPADSPQRRPERTKPAATPRQLASKSARPVPTANGGGRQATPKARPRSATTPRPSARDIALTRALYPSFLRAIGDGRAGTVDPATVGLADILREVDNYRRTRLPSWSERNWRNRLNHHGHKAHHAVIETALMAEIRDADRTDPKTGLRIPEHRKDRLGNPAAYLGGILWKKRGECRPDKTLERIAEARGIDVAALDNAAEAAGSGGITATGEVRERAKSHDAGENAVLDRRRDNGERRTEAERARWEEFRALVRSRSGDRNLKLFIETCRIRAIGDDGIEILAPSALIRDMVRQHMDFLQDAAGAFVGKPVGVSVGKGLSG